MHWCEQLDNEVIIAENTSSRVGFISSLKRQQILLKTVLTQRQCKNQNLNLWKNSE